MFLLGPAHLVFAPVLGAASLPAVPELFLLNPAQHHTKPRQVKISGLREPGVLFLRDRPRGFPVRCAAPMQGLTS